MAKLEDYRKNLLAVIQKHAQYKPSHGEIEPLCLCDPVTDNIFAINSLLHRSID